MTEDRKVEITKEDWDNLIPVKEVKIASQTICVKPLGFKKLRETIKKFNGIKSELIEQGITLDNYNETNNLLTLATVIFDKIPEVLANSTNIRLEDIENLPINIIVKIIEAILDSNIDSQKGLVKNLVTLANKASQAMQGGLAT